MSLTDKIGPPAEAVVVSLPTQPAQLPAKLAGQTQDHAGQLVVLAGTGPASRKVRVGQKVRATGVRLPDAQVARIMPPTYYASGSNDPGEIRGFAELGHPVGTVADQLLRHPAAKAEILATGGHVPVFVDSGAFSEVKFTARGPVVVKPITPAQWQQRLALYRELAAAIGPALSVVAPDQVGFAAATLARLARYRHEVRAIAAHGARILVPLQGQDKVAFWRQVQALDLAPAAQLVPALPMKKNATSDREAVDFVARAQPHALHLLGLGAGNRRVQTRALDLGAKKQRAHSLPVQLAAAVPGLTLSLDSNLIRANVERKARVRKLTAAQDAAREDLNEVRWGEGAPAGHMGVVGDYTDLIATPSAWMTPTAQRQFVKLAGLTAAEARRWHHDPDAFLQEQDDDSERRYQQPLVDLALDQLWAAYHAKATTTERKRRGIRAAFGPGGKRWHAPRRPSRLGRLVATLNRLTR